MAIEKSFQAILEGTPVSATHQVVNAELRAKLDETELIAAMSGLSYFVDEVADLPTGTEGQLAGVLNDGAANGMYLRGASDWVKTSILPAAFTDAVSALADLAAFEATLGTAANEDATSFATAEQGAQAEAATAAVAEAEPRTIHAADRPGDNPAAFSATLTGTGTDKTPLTTAASSIVTGIGTSYIQTGAGVIAKRDPVAIGMDVWEFTARFQRTSNPADPNNHAILLRAAWLDKDKAQISVETLATADDALTGSGLITLSARVSVLDVAGVIAPPAGAVYVCPYVQTYGEDGATAIATLRAEDITDLAGKADTADLGALATLDTATNAQLADMEPATIKGRADAAGTGAPVDLTAAQARTILNVEDGATGDQTGAEIKTAYELEPDTNPLTDEKAAVLAYQTQYPSGKYAAAWTDPLGYVGLGITFDGKVDLLRGDETLIEQGDASERFVTAWTDPLGYVALGIRENGQVFANLESSGFGQPISAETIRGMDGLNVWGGVTYNASLRRFLSDADYGDNAGSGLASYRQRFDITSNTSVAEAAVWRVIISYGQSLGVGGTESGDADPIYTVTAPHPRQAMMLSTGIRGSGSTSAFNATAATDIVGAREIANATQSETPGCGFMVQRIAADKARGNASNVYLYHAAGAGGQNIDVLAVGGQPYRNMLAAVDQIIALAAIYGARVEVQAFVWTHGEANAATDPAIYTPKLEAIIADLRSEMDTRDVVPSGGLPVFMDQVSSPSGNGSGRTPNTSFFEVEASDPLAFVSTAKYQLENTDGIHPKAPDTRIFGEYIAKAVDAVVNDGDWPGCRITAAEIVGDTVEITVNVPVGDLVIDTSNVPAVSDGNYGFIYEDDSASAEILSVTVGATVSNTCTITLQLDDTPSGANPVVMYAYDASSPMAEPYYGAVGNIRDSDTTPSSVPSADGGSGYLYNWLLIQPPLAL